MKHHDYRRSKGLTCVCGWVVMQGCLQDLSQQCVGLLSHHIVEVDSHPQGKLKAALDEGRKCLGAFRRIDSQSMQCSSLLLHHGYIVTESEVSGSLIIDSNF